jgi:predicted protein tyrosine phosphatase
MQLKYMIWHSQDGLAKHERVLSKHSLDRVHHEVEHLPRALELHFAGSSVNVQTERATEPGHLHVILESKRSADEIATSLVHCIRNLNNRTNGLCFVMQRE